MSRKRLLCISNAWIKVHIERKGVNTNGLYLLWLVSTTNPTQIQTHTVGNFEAGGDARIFERPGQQLVESWRRETVLRGELIERYFAAAEV